VHGHYHLDAKQEISLFVWGIAAAAISILACCKASKSQSGASIAKSPLLPAKGGPQLALPKPPLLLMQSKQ
jgi:hypothetical protein